jgi:hypothetical protein
LDISYNFNSTYFTVKFASGTLSDSDSKSIHKLPPIAPVAPVQTHQLQNNSYRKIYITKCQPVKAGIFIRNISFAGRMAQFLKSKMHYKIIKSNIKPLSDRVLIEPVAAETKLRQDFIQIP